MQKITTLAIIACFSSPVLAIDTGAISSPLNSLIINRPSDDRLKRQEFIPKDLPSFSLPPAEDALIPQQKSTVKINLKGIKFIGNSVISEAELQQIAQPFVGKVISITELEELRQKVSLYYVQRGFVNSGALLPEQQFKNGIITLQIIEGRLSEINVNGTERLRPSYISTRLQPDEDAVLDINELRQNFQLLLLDPLIERMNGSLIPSNQRGSSILNVDVIRARPYQLTLSADNYNPPSIGSTAGHLSGWVRNLTGFGDVVGGSVFYSGDGLLGGSGDFSIPLNRYNTRFNFHFDRNETKIIDPILKPLNIRSRFVDYSFGITQPVIQSLNRNFNVGLAFNYKKNKTSMLGKPFDFSQGAVDGASKNSVLRFSLDFTERFEHQVFSLRSTTNVGINAFGATWRSDTSIPSGNFVSWLGQAQYVGQIFDTDANLVLRGDVQYTDNSLMTLERFALGGRYSVRGYRENELVRDKGYDMSVEVRYPLFKEDMIGQLTVFPFFDYGAAQNRGDRDNISHLYSTGIGLEWKPIEQISTEIIYAYAIEKPTPKANHDLQDSGIQWRVNFSAF